MTDNTTTAALTKESHPYKKLITIAAIMAAAWGGISTVAHFIGYSFLQGRIAGHGLGEHELTLSNFESVMQAALVTKVIFQELSVSVISFFQMGIVGFIATALILGLLLKIFLLDLKQKKEQSKIAVSVERFFTCLPRWLKGVIIYPTISILGVIFIMFFILLMLNFLWANLTVAHSTGFRAGQKDIAVQHCVDISKIEKKEGYVASCSIFYDANKQRYIGRILHSNKEITLLQTNTESILFDKNRNIIACSVILNVALTSAEQPENKCNNLSTNQKKI